MEKLYLAKRKSALVEAMFLSNKTKEFDLKSEADFYLLEAEDNSKIHQTSISHISSIKQIPKNWSGSDNFLWGTPNDEEMTAKQFLESQTQKLDPEYKDFLRLKKKFENA